jgi:hypothetical protein
MVIVVMRMEDEDDFRKKEFVLKLDCQLTILCISIKTVCSLWLLLMKRKKSDRKRGRAAL